MIFYFTGSGNSYAAAKQIADQIGDSIYPLARFNDFEQCADEERIGIAFPCYVGKAPNIVIEFKEKLFQYINKHNTYVFCIVTYANSAAASYEDFKDQIDAWFEVKMPESDIANTKAPSDERQRQLLIQARAKIDGFANEVRDKKQVNYKSRPLQGMLLKVVRGPMIKMYQDFDKKLYADESCVNCGQCKNYCPLKNITFETKPVWGNNCVNCFGCVNRCPRNAIQYGEKTVGKKRYVHPDYKKVYY